MSSENRRSGKVIPNCYLGKLTKRVTKAKRCRICRKVVRSENKSLLCNKCSSDVKNYQNNLKRKKEIKLKNIMN